MTRLVLIRHGESLGNVDKRYTGWGDYDLSPTGLEEARAAGRLLRDRRIEFDIAFTSCLRRAIRTCWSLLDETDQMWLPIEKHWRLNERHYGVLNGLSIYEAADRFGAETAYDWYRSYDEPMPAHPLGDPSDPVNSRAYRSVRPDELPRAESIGMATDRILACWRESILPVLAAGQRALLVGHNTVIKVLIAQFGLLEGDDETIATTLLPTGAPLRIDFDESLKPVSHEFLGPKASTPFGRIVQPCQP